MCSDDNRRKQLVKDFELLRARIVHEDQLVNHRVGWMLAFTGFLFAAYGLSFTPEVNLLRLDVTEKVQEVRAIKERIAWLRDIFAITGVGISLAALFGIIAANRSILDCTADSRDRFRELESFGFLNPIGLPATNRAGMFASIAFPCVTMAIWLTILLSNHFVSTFWMVSGTLVVAAAIAGAIWYGVEEHAKARQELQAR